ncbi:GtrA family protein [Loigolactobacillus backii]|uniref:GtrA family protein n=1 Tax=Loigolactobacillus backii TaxID=375175 RepID=UPI0007F0C2B3|nr:GtrA family protein [Loigolactobacillus backii]ANK59160.1 hypothetical protein AYR52_02080 [Loigolactobacillus backii]ANK64150.1 hypothetical protein AYR54_02075 [Loigolactobacillus backii]ANK67455.1 hypothetical protein AYR55_06960 [Loigolactobacillus backii]MDA5387309.1 GtrA family protein [Loigolactobacillus backii]MDA5389849.1 GtrA family protein [Loigolactobacillus backii]
MQKHYQQLLNLFQQYKNVLAYLIFGGLTTLINIGVFGVLNTKTSLNYQIANVIAWFLSVLFAYVTNKLWVFASKTHGLKQLLQEMGSFFFFRVLSLLMDMAIMWVGISLLHANPLLTKIVDNVIVVIANYFFSKWYIFKSAK